MSDLNTENTEGYEPVDILDEDTGEVVGTSRMMADPNATEEGYEPINILDEDTGEVVGTSRMTADPDSTEEGYEAIDIIDEDTGEVVGSSRTTDDTGAATDGEEVEAIAEIDATEEGEAVAEIDATEEGEAVAEIDATTDGEVVNEEDVDLMLDDENVFTLDDFTVDEDGNLTLSDEQLEALMGSGETEIISSEPVEMSTAFLGISIIQFIVSIVLMSVVLQQTKSSSSVMASEPVGASGSYWSQNKGRSQESQLSKMTIFLAVLFFVLTLALGFLK